MIKRDWVNIWIYLFIMYAGCLLDYFQNQGIHIWMIAGSAIGCLGISFLVKHLLMDSNFFVFGSNLFLIVFIQDILQSRKVEWVAYLMLFFIAMQLSYFVNRWMETGRRKKITTSRIYLAR